MNDVARVHAHERLSPTLPSAAAKQRSPWADAGRQFVQNRMAVVGSVIVALFVAVAILAPVVAPRSPFSMDYASALAVPSLEHPFGTDELGRDMFSRIIHAARYDLGLTFATVLATIGIGLPIGAAAAYFGTWLDAVLMRLIDVALAFPAFVLALALVAIIGPSMSNIVIVLAISHAPRYARLVRGSALSVMQQDYVEAARVVGASNSTIIRRHILPNSIAPTIIYSTLDLGGIIVALAGLSFLGVGLQPPTPDWGSMLSDARSNLALAPWTAIFPGLAISISVIGFNFIGDGLRDALDPRIRR